MVPLEHGRVLVTGATGFIGSHLVRRLLVEGAEVHALSSTVSSVYPTRLLDFRERVELHEGNLTDRSAMDVLVHQVRPTHVFHLGAYTHVGKSWNRVDECIQANLQGTVNLLQALEPVGYERFVFTGTSEIYGDVAVPFVETAKVHPVSPYAVSKYAGEEFCRIFQQARGWPVVMVRPFNAYGPAQSPDRVVPEIIVRALRQQRLAMTHGLQTREFNYVEDLVDGLVRAATTEGVDGELFNLGCGEETSIRSLATTILELLGNPIAAEFDALPERPSEIPRMFSESSKARTLLGWNPRWTLADGLATTIDWYRVELERSGSPFAL